MRITNKFILLNITFALSILITSSFNTAYGHETVEIKDVNINGVPMLASIDQLIKIKGKPTKVKKIEPDFDSGANIEYSFNNDVFGVNKNKKIVDFKIIEENSFLLVKNRKVQIGSSVSTLKKYFPVSYKEYLKNHVFRIKFKNIDTYIVFTIEDNIIKVIETWEE